MEYFFSIIAGVIQGVTEFFPVSSSAHLFLFREFFGLRIADDLAFDVVLHLGTLLALLLYFWNEVRQLCYGFFQSIITRRVETLHERLAWYLIFATIPVVFVGLNFGDFIDSVFKNPLSIAIMLIVFGIFLIFADLYGKKTKTLSDIRFIDALFIGSLQSLALIEGVSRSGITIIAGLQQNLQRVEAARFSFLLSIPVILGAGLLKLSSLQHLDLRDGAVFLFGFLASFFSGYFGIRYFFHLISRYNFTPFAIYRIILGIVIFILVF